MSAVNASLLLKGISVHARVWYDAPVPDTLSQISHDIIACNRCPRLRDHCHEVATTKRRAYHDQTYWGKPVPGFGDPQAHLLIIGLAPAAHGANRTGRMFTGDRSGDFLFRALHKAGFANQPTSLHQDDGLRLTDAYITSALHCAPPANTPDRLELDRCRDYLVRDLRLLRRLRVVLALGRLAFNEYLRTLQQMGLRNQGKRARFQHGALITCGPHLPLLLCTYHPSQQNTQTGRLTTAMFDHIFEVANLHINHSL